MDLPIDPMKARLVDPISGVLEREGMSWEPKMDGYRMIADVRRGLLPRLFSRSGRIVTSEFPMIAEQLTDVQFSGVLDGEVVVLDEGRPSFNALQNKGKLSRQRLEADMRFWTFDLLEAEGRVMMRDPYWQRRRLMVELIDAAGSAPNVRAIPAVEDGAGLWRAMELAQMEGVIGKPVQSPYRPGERSAWLKLKRKQRRVFQVVGFTWGKEGKTGGRVGKVGALVLAVGLPDGRLMYAGKAGTGFDAEALDEALALLSARKSGTPFDDAEARRARRSIGAEAVVWVEPLQAEIEFSDTGAGGALIFPSFKGWVE